MLPVFMCLGARDNHGDRVGQSRTVVYCNVDPEYIAVVESTATPDNQGPVQDRANSTYQSSRPATSVLWSMSKYVTLVHLYMMQSY